MRLSFFECIKDLRAREALRQLSDTFTSSLTNGGQAWTEFRFKAGSKLELSALCQFWQEAVGRGPLRLPK